MKKFSNKIWFVTVPVVALSISIPVIVSSCSTSTNLQNNSTTEKPKPNPQPEPQPELNTLIGDDTNHDDFEPNRDNNRLYGSIIDLMLKTFKFDEDNSINKILKNYNNVNQQDIVDVIKMWSFNKWFDTKNKNELLKPMVSKLDIISISKEQNNWNISFDYTFELIDLNNTRILGQKRYTLNSTLSSNVTFSTKTTKFEVNGIDQLNEINPQLYSYNNSNVLEKTKEFLNETSSSFDTKLIIKDFLNKKNIETNLGNWKNINIKGISVSDQSFSSRLTIDLNELENEWNGLKKGLTKNDISNVIINNKENVQGKPNISGSLNNKFRELIIDDNKILQAFWIREYHSGNDLNFAIDVANLTNLAGQIIKTNWIIIKNYSK